MCGRLLADRRGMARNRIQQSRGDEDGREEEEGPDYEGMIVCRGRAERQMRRHGKRALAGRRFKPRDTQSPSSADRAQTC